MSWLFFLPGIGGVLIGFVATIWCIGIIFKGSHEEAKKQNGISADLMRERNRLDALKIDRLEGIQNQLGGAKL